MPYFCKLAKYENWISKVNKNTLYGAHFLPTISQFRHCCSGSTLSCHAPVMVLTPWLLNVSKGSLYCIHFLITISQIWHDMPWQCIIKVNFLDCVDYLAWVVTVHFVNFTINRSICYSNEKWQQRQKIWPYAFSRNMPSFYFFLCHHFWANAHLIGCGISQ